MSNIFTQLQDNAQLSRSECAKFLGISEGAVKDRRSGRYQPNLCELLLLSLHGSQSIELAEKRVSLMIADTMEFEVENGTVSDAYKFPQALAKMNVGQVVHPDPNDSEFAVESGNALRVKRIA